MKHERLLETVKGRLNAHKFIASWIKSFHELNGEGRMVAGQSDMEYWDFEGSGEFIHARCSNINQAETFDDEVYQIYILA
jgi:hypothetical protein